METHSSIRFNCIDDIELHLTTSTRKNAQRHTYICSCAHCTKYKNVKPTMPMK